MGTSYTSDQKLPPECHRTLSTIRQARGTFSQVRKCLDAIWVEFKEFSGRSTHSGEIAVTQLFEIIQENTAAPQKFEWWKLDLSAEQTSLHLTSQRRRAPHNGTVIHNQFRALNRLQVSNFSASINSCCYLVCTAPTGN